MLELDAELCKKWYFDLEEKCAVLRLENLPGIEHNLKAIPKIFKEFVQGISVPDLEKEAADFRNGHGTLKSLLDHAIKVTKESKLFPFKGCIKEIGSCWDCSKIGQVDEFDLLFVLQKDEITVSNINNNSAVTWCNNNYTVREFIGFFANCLDEVLRDHSPPVGLQHGGCASPLYSGVRICGPAVTLLYKTDDMEHDQMPRLLSLDITLALPISCFKSGRALYTASQAWINSMSDKIARSISYTLEPHFVPSLTENTWRPTTAHIEADLLHILDSGSPLKKTHLLLKALMQMIEMFASHNQVFHGPGSSNDVQHRELTDALICCLKRLDSSVPEQKLINGCMRYAHSFLPGKTKKRYNEITKPDIAVNKAAAKHSLLARVGADDLSHKDMKHKRVFRLMKEVVEEITDSGMYVRHCISQDFSDICKFSFWKQLISRRDELVAAIVAGYTVVLDTLFTEVSR